MSEPVDARAREKARERLEAKDFSGALAAAREAITLAPAEPYNHWLAGWIRMCTPGRTREDVEDAIAGYRKALELAVRGPRAMGSWVADLGDALLAAQRDDEAVVTVTAETRNPDHEIAAHAHTWLGWYFSRKREELEPALRHLLEGTRLRTQWGLALLNLAYVEDRLGLRARAFAHYVEAVQRKSYDDAFAERRARELREEMEHAMGDRRVDGAELTARAREVMVVLAERQRADGFRQWWTEIAPDVLGETAEELVLAGFVVPLEGSATAYRLSDEGRSWILTHLGLVVAFCPKCSSAVQLPKGLPIAQAGCPTCFVRWQEDTTVEPFVPRY